MKKREEDAEERLLVHHVHGVPSRQIVRGCVGKLRRKDVDDPDQEVGGVAALEEKDLLRELPDLPDVVTVQVGKGA